MAFKSKLDFCPLADTALGSTGQKDIVYFLSEGTIYHVSPELK